MMRALNKLNAPKVRTCAPGKYSDDGGLWLHKREDGVGQRAWDRLRGFAEVGPRICRKMLATVRGNKDPIKERKRERREAFRSLHLLNNVALDAFESRKTELKGDGLAGSWFSPLNCTACPNWAMFQSHLLIKTISHTKAETAPKAMNSLGIRLTHGATLGLDVDLQAVDKAMALLGKQRHKAQNVPALLYWREVLAFY
jgi:hypothetical protein